MPHTLPRVSSFHSETLRRRVDAYASVCPSPVSFEHDGGFALRVFGRTVFQSRETDICVPPVVFSPYAVSSAYVIAPQANRPIAMRIIAIDDGAETLDRCCETSLRNAYQSNDTTTLGSDSAIPESRLSHPSQTARHSHTATADPAPAPTAPRSHFHTPCEVGSGRTTG